MRIRITKPGIYGTGPLEVGSEFDLGGHPPASWAGKYVVVSEGPAEGSVPVTGEDTPGDGAEDGMTLEEVNDLTKDGIIAKLDELEVDYVKKQGVDALRRILIEELGLE